MTIHPDLNYFNNSLSGHFSRTYLQLQYMKKIVFLFICIIHIPILVYSESNVLLYSDGDFNTWTNTLDPLLTSQGISTLNLDPVQAVSDLGITEGKIKTLFNFIPKIPYSILHFMMILMLIMVLTCLAFRNNLVTVT